MSNKKKKREWQLKNPARTRIQRTMERFAFQRGERTHEHAEILCDEATVVFRRLRIHTTFVVKKALL